MIRVETYTEGKVRERNEDRFAYAGDAFVIVDGATDTSGRIYDGKTGGEIVAELVCKECLVAGLDGAELARYLNGKVREKYVECGILGDIGDARYRFTCGFVQVRVVGDRVIVTSVGDLGFRVNGRELHMDVKQVDIENADRRAECIARSGDVATCTESIRPYILGRFAYQNISRVSLGYGVVDGTETPDEYVKTFGYPLSDIRTIELFTDGYLLVPEAVSIDAWERAHGRVEAEDPDKWKVYRSTKSKDDRTVSIIRFV